MNKAKYILLTALFALLAPGTVAADNKPLIEKFKKQLVRTTNARDSLRILYDIFDLSNRKGQIETAWQIYETAGRAENETAQADILRQLAVFNHSSDSVINHLVGLAEQLSNADRRAATKIFIINQRINKRGRLPNDHFIDSVLIGDITAPTQTYDPNIYKKIGLLYQVIQYMGADADGVFFKESLDQYDRLIKQLPASDYPLINQFYTTAAIIHSRYMGDGAKAIKYDRKLLGIVSELEKMYRKKNRRYRNYDTSKYICYRRMLSNYQYLSAEEIETITDSISALAAANEDIASSLARDPRPYAYYYMSLKEYDKAIPFLQKIIGKDPTMSFDLMKHYRMLMKAAKATGRTALYADTMEKFITCSESIDSMRKETLKKEVLLHDSLYNTPLFKIEKPAKKAGDNAGESPSVLFYIVSGILALILILYVILYVRLRIRK